jgi:hypothetical protein
MIIRRMRPAIRIHGHDALHLAERQHGVVVQEGWIYGSDMGLLHCQQRDHEQVMACMLVCLKSRR